MYDELAGAPQGFVDALLFVPNAVETVFEEASIGTSAPVL
jgi:hypothetical protein